MRLQTFEYRHQILIPATHTSVVAQSLCIVRLLILSEILQPKFLPMNEKPNSQSHYRLNVVDNTLRSLICDKKPLPMRPGNACKDQETVGTDVRTFGGIWRPLQQIVRSALAYAKIALSNKK